MLEPFVARLKEHVLSLPDGIPFPVATKATIEQTEKSLGFVIPATLKAIYLEVGNGGFGPGCGVIGVPGGFTSSSGDLIAMYREFEQGCASAGEKWPHGLLPFCEWGCAMYFCVDCTNAGEPARLCDGGVLSTPKYSLLEFFEMWLSGTDILALESWVVVEREFIDPFTKKKRIAQSRKLKGNS